MPVVKVNLGRRSYPVAIGAGASNKLPEYLKAKVVQNRVFVFYDAQFYALHGRRVSRYIKQVVRPVELVLPRGERVKSATQVKRLYSYLLGQKVSLADFILACGGGVTSDLIGYVAATSMRGIQWGVLSTTLLGMVDASIGGKTAINHPGGKNLIGAFWQPSFVISDTDYLLTLARKEVTAGLGEVVKYGGLAAEPILDRLDDYLSAGNCYDVVALNRLVLPCARYKAAVVSKDEREGGPRMLLNLGHTFSHAIESATRALSHGEALPIGLLAACYLSTALEPSRQNRLAGYLRLLERFLQLVPHRRIDVAAARQAMTLDKKRRGSAPKFILLDKPGKPI
ncbi:MAG: 3-dehydroquinate synthase, partial [Candidatus Zixiibacteriota bacterium]